MNPNEFLKKFESCELSNDQDFFGWRLFNGLKKARREHRED